MNPGYRDSNNRDAEDFPQPDPSQRVNFNKVRSQGKSGSKNGFRYGHDGPSNQNDAYKDFENLCKDIESVVVSFTKSASEGFGQAGSAIGEVVSQAISSAQEAQAKKRKENKSKHGARQEAVSAQRSMTLQRNALLNKRFKAPSPTKAAGVSMAIVGGMCAFSGAVSTATLLFSDLATAPMIPSLFTTVGLTALFAWLLAAGVRRVKMADYIAFLRRVMGTREVITFDEISSQLHISKAKALKMTRKALKAGLIKEGHIDDECTCLMVTNHAYNLYRQSKQAYMERVKEEEARNSVKNQAKIINVRPGLTDEDKAFIKKGQDYVNQLHELDVAIDDIEVSRKIVAIESVVKRILQRAEDDPQVIAKLDRLEDYYLPTTVKLLMAYDALEDETIQGENIRQSRQEIERTLDVLANAYEKLLDSTYKDLSIDVASDITVLNSFLAQDGLTEDPFTDLDSKGK